MLCFLNTESLKTSPSPSPAESLLHPKVTAMQPLYHIFTSSPIRTSLKRPLFKGKSPGNSSMHMEISDHSLEEETQRITSSQRETDAACIEQKVPDASTGIEVEPHNMEPCTVITPPGCDSKPSAASDPDEDDEDQTVFFTPELFEGEDNGRSPLREMTTESPTRTKSPSALSHELLEQGPGLTSAADGQSAVTVSELSQGQIKGSGGQKEGEERDRVDSGCRQTDIWLCRLSRSRQNASGNPTGN